MQRAEMEELRQRDANLTALQAIGPRKKLKLDGDAGGVGAVSILNSFFAKFLLQYLRHTGIQWRWSTEQLGHGNNNTATADQAGQSARHALLYGAGTRV